MKSKYILFVAITTTMSFLIGCGGDSKTNSEAENMDSSKMSNTVHDTSEKKMNSMNMQTADGDMMASMNSSMAKMTEVKMSGDFDQDFANMMIEHHQGAIDMSEQEIKTGKEGKIKEMAQQIVTSQNKEQTVLKDILKNYKPVKMAMGKHDELMQYMEEMKSDMAAIKMPGKSDIDFSLMMIAHHESAIKMAKAELKHGMNNQLKLIAKKEIDDQTMEISEFNKWIRN